MVAAATVPAVLATLTLLATGCIVPAGASLRAAGGDPKAQLALAEGFESGAWGEPNPESAHHWYRRAARKGSMQAQLALARSYAHGMGVLEDQAEALRWYQAAAWQGSTEAQVELARSLESGDGVARDPQLAFTWYRRAAEAGHVEARQRLASQLESEGRVDEALAWYRLAAEQGHPHSQLALGTLLATDSGEGEGLAEAWFWLRSSAESGVEEAELALQVLAPRLLGAERATAERRLQQARTDGGLANVADVQYALGLRHAVGEGVARDPLEALRWWHRAAARGHAGARLEIGLAHARGVGVPRDLVRARAWLELAEDPERASLRSAWLTRLDRALGPDERSRAEQLAGELRTRLAAGEETPSESNP